MLSGGVATLAKKRWLVVQAESHIRVSHVHVLQVYLTESVYELVLKIVSSRTDLSTDSLNQK